MSLEDSIDSGNSLQFGEDMCESTPASSEDTYFDNVVSVLQDILMDDAFTDLQSDWCLEHCDVFSEDDEMKLEYTPLFSEYTELIESFITERLTAEIEGFDMQAFGGLMAERADEMIGDVFDMLMSFTEFEEFKDLMVSYKHQKEGKGGWVDAAIDVLGQENLAAEGVDLGIGGMSIGEGKKPATTYGSLSPTSREAKDAGLSP